MPSPPFRVLIVLSIVALVALVATGCGPGQTAATATPAAAATVAPVPTVAPATSAGASGAINVTLQEFAVLPQPGAATAGDVTFTVTNKGTVEHEFVVIKTDLAPNQLPTKSTGEVDEDGAGIEVIDEVEEMPAGETEDLKVNLDAGTYVLICNVLDGDTSHYQSGMRIAFEVN